MDEREQPPACAPAVGLSLCDSAPLLWRMEDLRSARARGLVGALLGSLPRTPRQNLRLGRPLLLLPEEERLLSEEHAAAALPAHPQVSHREPLAAAQHDFRFPASALAVQLSTARAGLSHCAESRASLRAHWPVREHACRSSTRYQVFRDLRRRGFFLTSAGKFGGDFLVYPGERPDPASRGRRHPARPVIASSCRPGDPLRFHAHFIAVC
ncbi:unnamed protein product, partial [Tetraodon nigroviridis]